MFFFCFRRSVELFCTVLSFENGVWLSYMRIFTSGTISPWYKFNQGFLFCGVK